jgi:hypothetical protein
MAQLILKRAPMGDNQDDYDVLESDVIVGRIFTVPTAPRAGPGCGRAATTARYAARRTDMSRRARRRWRLSLRAGGGSRLGQPCRLGLGGAHIPLWKHI